MKRTIILSSLAAILSLSAVAAAEVEEASGESGGYVGVAASLTLPQGRSSTEVVYSLSAGVQYSFSSGSNTALGQLVLGLFQAAEEFALRPCQQEEWRFVHVARHAGDGWASPGKRTPEPPCHAERPIVRIDDCLLSAARFGHDCKTIEPFHVNSLFPYGDTSVNDR